MPQNTDSVQKQRRNKAKPGADVGLFESVIHKFDCVVRCVGNFLLKNFGCIICCTVVFTAIAYLHASSDVFEQILAFLERREPVLSDPPKSVTLSQFLHLCCLKAFLRENKVLVAIMVPLILYIFYSASQASADAQKLAQHDRS